ncbi:MAG: methylated-DNA--[protein]-cysteine S-methyltransferase [Planctomycetota bacterium]
MSAIVAEISAQIIDAGRAAAGGDRETVGQVAIGAQVPLVVQTSGGPVTLLTRDASEALLLRTRIEAWLAGSDDDFRDVPLSEGTAFQKACWRACCTIPRGETRSYSWLAAAAGSPRAARAAGQAMRRNPMPIVVPCHRVVGSGNWIGGYAGDARQDGALLGIKRALLELEARSADVNCPARDGSVGGSPLIATAPRNTHPESIEL